MPFLFQFLKKVRESFLSFLPFRIQIFFFALGKDLFLFLLKKKFNAKKTTFKKKIFEQKNLKKSTNKNQQIKTSNNQIKKFGLTFRHSLGNAAGFDKDGDLLHFHYQIGTGFAMIGTVLNKPHKGNLYSFFLKKINVWLPLDKSRSAINSLGLPSIGIDKVVLKIKRFRKIFTTEKNPYGKIANFPIGISLMGHPLQSGEQQLDGILESIEKSAAWVDMIEINESCPNVKKEKQSQKGFINRIEKIDKAVNQAKLKYSKEIALFIKFTELKDIDFLVTTLEKNGVDAITLSNTFKNYDELVKNIDLKEKKKFESYTNLYQGGVSGKAIWCDVLQNIKQLQSVIDKKKSKLKIIHCGGIFDSQDLKTAKKNTVLQQWYTGFISNYLEGKDVYQEILREE